MDYNDKTERNLYGHFYRIALYKQKQLSRKKKGSNNRKKSKLTVAKTHEKIRNSRIDYIHKVSNKLTNENQVVVVEDLNVKGMMKNHKLAKSIGDVAWHEFKRQLEYKSNWKGRNFVEIDRFFPSSKTCGSCGFKNQALSLKDRSWQCPECNIELDRDLNASINILHEGLFKLTGCRDYSRKLGELPALAGAVNQEAQWSLAVG